MLKYSMKPHGDRIHDDDGSDDRNGDGKPNIKRRENETLKKRVIQQKKAGKEK